MVVVTWQRVALVEGVLVIDVVGVLVAAVIGVVVGCRRARRAKSGS